MKKDIGALFDDLLIRYTTTVEQNIRSRIKKARDKDHVKAEIRSEVSLNIRWVKTDKAGLAADFLERFKKGEDTAKIFAHIRKKHGENVEDIIPLAIADIIKNGKSIDLYISEEEKAVKKLALDDRKLLLFFIRYIANLDIRKRLPDLFNTEEKPKLKTQNNPIVKWMASKDNKNDFVQLIYSLHEAGFINGGKGEITKITESLAGVFGVNLGDNWQTNHSKSIHNANRGYKPPVFRKIQEAYQQYSENQIENKNKKK
ncbi:MAG: RteC domain-containing protein [Bacteroidia bacterium]